MVKRRDSVTATGSLALAAGMLPRHLLAAPGESLDLRAVALDSGMSQAKFAALLGETFHLHTEPAGVLPAHLVEVRERATRKPGPANLEQFSATFQAPRVAALQSGLYGVEHWLAGKTPLFLSATGDGRYRAGFSLLR